SALHDATIRVLTANGCEVVVPAGQTCCGALAAHAGVRDTARSLAQANLDVFLRDDFDAVITNAAGCGSTLKEYEPLYAGAMADYCCGSAGSYNVTETQTSLDILAEKMKHALATNAPLIVTANPGCLLQMRAGAKIHSTGQEVVHVIELLDRALDYTKPF